MKSILTAMFLASASMAVAGTYAKNPKAPAPVAPAPACPALSYSYAELGYIHQDSSIGEADGGYLDLSYALGGNFFLDATGTLTEGDFDYQEFGAGVGYFQPISDKVHFILRAGWANVEDVGPNVNELYISPGIRVQVSCNLELFAKVYYHLPEGSDENWSVGGGVLYHLCPKSAIVLGGALGEDDEWSVQAGLRWSL
jgi:hypothetical protein